MVERAAHSGASYSGERAERPDGSFLMDLSGNRALFEELFAGGALLCGLFGLALLCSAVVAALNATQPGGSDVPTSVLLARR